VKKEYDFSKGRRGAVIKAPGKTRITMYVDDDVLDAFRDRAEASGQGYQTLINAALREYLGTSASREPMDEETLRRVLREELRGKRRAS
jgi:uncharacterized protein (DUF4415 family)